MIDREEKLRLKSKEYLKLKRMARQYDEIAIRVLGGFANEKTVEPHIRIEAIKVLLDRGHGRPKSRTEHKGPAADGSHTFVVRMIHEGKPKGEK